MKNCLKWIQNILIQRIIISCDILHRNCHDILRKKKSLNFSSNLQYIKNYCPYCVNDIYHLVFKKKKEDICHVHQVTVFAVLCSYLLFLYRLEGGCFSWLVRIQMQQVFLGPTSPQDLLQEALLLQLHAHQMWPKLEDKYRWVYKLDSQCSERAVRLMRKKRKPLVSLNNKWQDFQISTTITTLKILPLEPF